MEVSHCIKLEDYTMCIDGESTRTKMVESYCTKMNESHFTKIDESNCTKLDKAL